MITIQILGRLTYDPEVKYTKEGVQITSFSMASNHIKDTTFLNVVAFGKPAENIAKYCKKGNMIFVAGHLIENIWQTNTGETKRRFEVHAESFSFAGESKKES